MVVACLAQVAAGTSWWAIKMVTQGARETDVLSRCADPYATLKIAGLLPRRPHLADVGTLPARADRRLLMVELACRAVRRAAYVRLWPESGTRNALTVLAVFCILFADLLTAYIYHRDHLPPGTYRLGPLSDPWASKIPVIRLPLSHAGTIPLHEASHL